MNKFTMMLSRHYRTAIATVIFGLLIGVTGHAQVTQQKRYELLQKNFSENFTVINLMEDGIALMREQNKYNGTKRKWQIIVLDTTLHEKVNRELEIEQRNTLLGYEYVSGQLFLLFRMGDTNRNNLALVSMNVRTGEEGVVYEIKPELDFKLTHFIRAGTHVVLGGYVNNEPAVLIYSPLDNQIKVLPGFFQKDTEIVDLRLNQNGTFNTILIDRSTRAERKLIFRAFDETGKLLLESFAPIDDNITLQATLSSALEREDLMLMGTWGERSGKQSLGFFSLPVDPSNEQKIKYTYFGQLTHFTDYLKPKRAKRIQENTAEDLKAGKKPDFIAYVMPFKIEEYDEGFMMIAEVYNPHTVNPYSSNPYYNNPYGYNPYGFYNPYWPGYYPGMRMYRPSYMYGNNMKNTDEVKTFASVLVSYDPQGNLRWDYSMKIDDIDQAALEQVATFHYTPSSVVFMYKKESDLNIRTINRETGEGVESSQKILLDDPVDEVRSDQPDGGVIHWFGDYYFIWGSHTIRNVTKDDRTRDVFYVNKVRVR